MAYDPSATPVRERILQNVETVLLSIGPPSYGTDTPHVRRWNGNADENIPTTPAVLIVPLPETSDDEVSCMVRHTMELGLIAVLRTDTWPAEINKFLADMRVALLADPSRGGIAVTTRITDENVADNDPAENLGSAQMIVQVHYRTLYDDPNTPI